jgi:superfamily I DNA/RNA helicase
VKSPWPKTTSSTHEEFWALFDGDKTMMKIADIYQAYDEAKVNKMLLDFDDLLLEAYYLLRDNDEVERNIRAASSPLWSMSFKIPIPSSSRFCACLSATMAILILQVSG